MRPAIFSDEDQQWVQVVPHKEYYTVQDISVILNVGGPSVYGAIKRGTLKGVRVNGKVHATHDALVAYIQKRIATQVSFSESGLVIEDIVPTEEAGRVAAQMLQGVTPEGGDEAVGLDFLDEE